MSEELETILKEYHGMFVAMSKTMSCGMCGNTTTIASDSMCVICGRMLCGKCGKYCEHHKE